MATFTNPANSTEVYVTGNRGKPPGWLKTVPAYLVWREEANKAKEAQLQAEKAARKANKVETVAEEVQDEKVPEIASNEPQTPKLMKWCWRFNDEEIKSQAQCVVVAYSALEARTKLNKTFSNPVTLAEFMKHWKQIDLLETDKVGVFEFKDNLWIDRKEK
jgi:hypothetical protein